MPCFHPMPAFRAKDGSVVFVERSRYGIEQYLELPCGQCIGCRLERSRQWAMRCLHESSLYKRNCFLTLTYDDEHIPPHSSLRYEDFQKFMKRLRRRFHESEIRFYMCGEYGENTARPHYHACLFNFDFADKKFFKRTKDGSRLYTSAVLESLWPFGMCSIGDVTFQSAGYVARYCMKKVTGKNADDHYGIVDQDTGEIVQRVPEFNHMSLKPGIGAPWLDKFQTDVYPLDYCVVNGRKVKPPKFYDRVFQRLDGESFELIQYKRFVDSRVYAGDNSNERLAVKKQVVQARAKMLARNLE